MNTDEFIASLQQDGSPVVPVRKRRLVIEWLVVAVLSLAMGVLTSGLRADWPERVNDLRFMTEIVAALLLSGVSGVMAISLSYPDGIKHRKTCVAAWLLGAVVFLATCGWNMTPSVSPALHPHTAECLVCMMGFALLPTVWLLWRLRKMASVQPELMGLCGLTMAATLSCAGVTLVEDTVSPQGLLLWHYLPVILLCMSGLWIGKKLFRW